MKNEDLPEKEKDTSLKDLIEIELQNLKLPPEFQSLEQFITDGKRSAAFIRAISNDESFDIPDESSELYEVAEMRARHSAVTFLVGLVLRHFGGLFDSIPTTVNNQSAANAMQMWLITSLYHDKAYSSTYIKRKDLDIKKLFSPFLLTDDYADSRLECLRDYSHLFPNSLAHTYETILNYDDYAIEYHNSHKSNEKRDHGILGGAMMFGELVSKSLKQKSVVDLPTIKACSLAVAQHNIFKNTEKDEGKRIALDHTYRRHSLFTLMSDSSFRIQRNNSLLLFLSLVDTIECVKKFSKSQNEKKYLETLTTLKHIKVVISSDQIVINLSGLAKEIKKKKSTELENALIAYKDALAGFSDWTAIFSECKSGDDNLITISIDGVNQVDNRVLAATGSI